MKNIWNMIASTVAGVALSSVTACTGTEMTEVTPFSSQIFSLGESPWWDADKKELVMIDIEGQSLAVHSSDGMRMRKYMLHGTPGTVVPTDKGNYLIAMGNAILLYSERGIVDTLVHEGFDTDSLRFNDGKVSPDGIFWVGTVDCKTYSQPTARLYSTDGKNIKTQLEGITVSNGISWSPDGKTMYYIDSPTRTVKAFDYDREMGGISNGRIVISTPEDWGTPDGCCIDSQGNLWVAQWGGACVAMWDTKTGRMIRKIDVPAKNVTAVALGGEMLDQLFITTAAIAMEAEDIAKYPLAGSLFSIKVAVPGLLRSKWTER